MQLLVPIVHSLTSVCKYKVIMVNVFIILTSTGHVISSKYITKIARTCVASVGVATLLEVVTYLMCALINICVAIIPIYGAVQEKFGLM